MVRLGARDFQRDQIVFVRGQAQCIPIAVNTWSDTMATAATEVEAHDPGNHRRRDPEASNHIDKPAHPEAAKAACGELIRLIPEIDPLTCPRSTGRITALFRVIERRSGPAVHVAVVLGLPAPRPAGDSPARRPGASLAPADRYCAHGHKDAQMTSTDNASQSDAGASRGSGSLGNANATTSNDT